MGPHGKSSLDNSFFFVLEIIREYKKDTTKLGKVQSLNLKKRDSENIFL